jgi:hypothetical protein
MVKADWVQVGRQVANPYFGHKMSDCGEVRKEFQTPPAGSSLAEFVSAYLDVQKHLNDDTLDQSALAKLKAAVANLTEQRHAALKEATGKFTGATDLKSARDSFQALSAQLIAVLDRQGK